MSVPAVFRELSLTCHLFKMCQSQTRYRRRGLRMGMCLGYVRVDLKGLELCVLMRELRF